MSSPAWHHRRQPVRKSFLRGRRRKQHKPLPRKLGEGLWFLQVIAFLTEFKVHLDLLRQGAKIYNTVSRLSFRKDRENTGTRPRDAHRTQRGHCWQARLCFSFYPHGVSSMQPSHFGCSEAPAQRPPSYTLTSLAISREAFAALIGIASVRRS